jgi:hypothetical protein
MELWLGVGHNGPAFRLEQEKREAWVRHRERLMVWLAKNGKRPMGWWQFESPIPYPGSEREQSTLFEAGLLAEDEGRELVAWWKAEFDRAWDEHFFFCSGPNQFFEGPVARRKHYRWADIPPRLIKQWASEYKRRSRTIRALVDETA